MVVKLRADVSKSSANSLEKRQLQVPSIYSTFAHMRDYSGDFLEGGWKDFCYLALQQYSSFHLLHFAAYGTLLLNVNIRAILSDSSATEKLEKLEKLLLNGREGRKLTWRLVNQCSKWLKWLQMNKIRVFDSYLVSIYHVLLQMLQMLQISRQVPVGARGIPHSTFANWMRMWLIRKWITLGVSELSLKDLHLVQLSLNTDLFQICLRFPFLDTFNKCYCQISIRIEAQSGHQVKFVHPIIRFITFPSSFNSENYFPKRGKIRINRIHQCSRVRDWGIWGISVAISASSPIIPTNSSIPTISTNFQPAKQQKTQITQTEQRKNFCVLYLRLFCNQIANSVEILFVSVCDGWISNIIDLETKSAEKCLAKCFFLFRLVVTFLRTGLCGSSSALVDILEYFRRRNIP